MCTLRLLVEGFDQLGCPRQVVSHALGFLLLDHGVTPCRITRDVHRLRPVEVRLDERGCVFHCYVQQCCCLGRYLLCCVCIAGVMDLVHQHGAAIEVPQLVEGTDGQPHRGLRPLCTAALHLVVLHLGR